MIASTRRLADDRQIKKVLQKGTAQSGSFFKIKALKNPRLLSLSRLAVVVSKKISNRAVVRNLIKRRTKAVFSEGIKNLSGYDIVVFPTKQVEKAYFEDLKEDARQCLKKLVSSQ